MQQHMSRLAGNSYTKDVYILKSKLEKKEILIINIFQFLEQLFSYSFSKKRKFLVYHKTVFFSKCNNTQRLNIFMSRTHYTSIYQGDFAIKI